MVFAHLFRRSQPRAGQGLQPRRPHSCRPRLEHREDRQLLTVTAVLNAGTLTVMGDGAANTISLLLQRGQIHVQGAVAPNSFHATSVSRINVQAGEGSDTVNVESSLQAS